MHTFIKECHVSFVAVYRPVEITTVSEKLKGILPKTVKSTLVKTHFFTISKSDFTGLEVSPSIIIL